MRILNFYTYIFFGIFTTSLFAQIAFDDLVMDYASLPPLLDYNARDKQKLQYRYYPSKSKNLLVLIHGSAWHSKYLMKMALEISKSNLAQVVTPDLRGHGVNPKKRGHVSYIGQLDDDLGDFIEFLKSKHQVAKIIVGGHSSGGGLALRFSSSKYKKLADAFLLLAPYLSHDAPTVNQNSGWANAKLLKVIPISILNGFGIHWFDDAITVTFNLPKKFRDGTETLSYSHAMITSYTPADYVRDIKEISKPTLVAVGAADEAMVASEFPKVFSINSSIEVRIIDGINHMGIVLDNSLFGQVKGWILKHLSAK